MVQLPNNPQVFLLDPAPPEVDRRLKTIVTEYASRVTFAGTPLQTGRLQLTAV